MLKNWFHTVGGSVHEEEARMSKVHNEVDDSTHKKSKEVEYDFDVSKLWWFVMSTCTWEGAFLNITFEE